MELRGVCGVQARRSGRGVLVQEDRCPAQPVAGECGDRLWTAVRGVALRYTQFFLSMFDNAFL